VGLGHVAEDALPDPLDQQADMLAGVALVAHLRGDVLGLGQIAELAGLVEVVTEGLLAVDAAPRLQGADAGGEVMVVGRGHPDRVQVLLLVEELAIVGVYLRVGNLPWIFLIAPAACLVSTSAAAMICSPEATLTPLPPIPPMPTQAKRIFSLAA